MMLVTLPFQLLQPCVAQGCTFDKSATPGVIVFELFVVIMAIISVRFIGRVASQPLVRFGLVAWGVFLFEFFTHPMWLNQHMGPWAYLYRDVSWVLTIGWTTILLTVITAVDTLRPKWSAFKKFGSYLLYSTLFGIVGETFVVKLGLRSYSPESMAVIGNHLIPGLGIPWASLYYIPVFMSLVIAFYKYAALTLDNTPVVPLRRRPWLRSFIVSFIAVSLYEIMIEPMVVNAKFPAWSYWYRDVSAVLTGAWVLVIWLASNLIERVLIHRSLSGRFVATVGLASVLFFPLEAWFIHHGYRLYTESVRANFSGYHFPFTNIPIEVAIAIPFYLSLVLGFIRYWEIQFDNPVKRL